MIFKTQYFAITAIFSTLANALPLDTASPRNNVPRAKSYSVINVDGGASTAAPADATTIVEQSTTTVEVANPAPTVTAEITTTIVEPAPAPASTSARSYLSQSPSSSIWTSTTTIPTSASPIVSTIIETPKPIFVTVTVTDDDGPTEYYDSGMWHTSYRIKSFEVVATAPLLSTLSTIASVSTGLPVL